MFKIYLLENFTIDKLNKIVLLLNINICKMI